MKPEQTALRLGTIVLIGAVLLRLLSNISGPAAQALPQTQLAQVLLFLQTGRLVDTAVLEVTPPSTEATPTESPAPTQPPTPPAVFTAGQAQLILLRNTTSYELDPAGLLTQPLSWELTGDRPTVLILHTHGTESYADTENYRSTNEAENMLAVGDRLAALLEAEGICVLHDRTLHDTESYNGSYAHARTSLEQYLSQYPSIQLVLDLHRDAAEDDAGNQIDYTVATPAGEAAKLMLVMGTDAGGFSHPRWQENMALAVKLQASLETICPEICRPIYVRTSRFNQDLSTGALLIEVGAAGNTLSEALLATEILAQGILSLAHGANT